MKPDLHTIATPVLELTAKRLRTRKGDESPVDLTEVKAWGISAAAQTLTEQLGGMSRTTALMAVQATLNERAVNRPPPPQLVWTGTSPGKNARDTRVLLSELFNSAERSVLIAGYSFDDGSELFQPLHEGMATRGLDVRFYINIEQRRGPIVTRESVELQVEQFLKKNWPFSGSRPTVFYDERVLEDGIFASLHAKCVVIDERLALITSANFTARGQDRNIEVGVVLEDEQLSQALVANFVQGRFERAGQPQ